MSETLKGRKLSTETVKKMSKANTLEKNPQYKKIDSNKLKELIKKGHTDVQIAEKLNIHRMSVYNKIKEHFGYRRLTEARLAFQNEKKE